MENNFDGITQVSENTENTSSKRSIWGKLKIWIIIFLVLSLVWGIGYYFYKWATNIYVDNPTDKELSIQFDDWNAIKIPAKSLIEVPLKTGKHNLKVDGKDLWNFEKKLTEISAFLNPTKHVYVKEYILYIASDARNPDALYEKLPSNTIDLNWEPVAWPFELVEWIYINKNWDYGITVKEPDEVTVGQWEDYAIKTKLHRYDDFVDVYKKEYTER